MPRIRDLAGPFFVFAGVMHFVIPKTYRQIMPPYIPAPEAMVYASGVAEIAGGAGLMASQGRARRLGGGWLIATLIAVFPANLHMALHPDDYSKVPGGRASLWGRLPFQGVFVAWVLAAMKR
ncbi:MAG: DoxX family protein [Solirubrobacteraceae bacterium]